MTPFLGHCYASRSSKQFHLVAAVFCSDRNDYETLVSAALRAQGYQFYWAEDVLLTADWVKRFPAEAADAVALARKVNEESCIALGQITRLAGSDDEAAQAQNWLQIEESAPFKPLDTQFGVHPAKNVPEELREALFGQPYPTDTLPLITYAVLDAAKMPYLLTSLLESSDLRYQSLFQGEAQEELAEHAPYLVELTEDSGFTRRLFTGPEGICGLWEKDLGIFLRSCAGFEALRKHLRKFIKVQNKDGKWFYFRFWERRYAHLFFGTACAETCWMMTVSKQHTLTLLWSQGSSLFTARALRSMDDDIVMTKPTQEWVAALAKQESMTTFQNKIIHQLILPHPQHGHMTSEQAQALAKALIAQAQSFGFKSEYALSSYVTVALELSRFPITNPNYLNILQSAKHPDTKAELMLKSIISTKGNTDE